MMRPSLAVAFKMCSSYVVQWSIIYLPCICLHYQVCKYTISQHAGHVTHVPAVQLLQCLSKEEVDGLPHSPRIQVCNSC